MVEIFAVGMLYFSFDTINIFITFSYLFSITLNISFTKLLFLRYFNVIWYDITYMAALIKASTFFMRSLVSFCVSV